MSLLARMPHPAPQGQLLRIVTAPSTPQLNQALLYQASPHHCTPHAFVGAGAHFPFYFLLIITLPVTWGKGLYGAFWWPSALFQLVTPGGWWNFLSLNFLVCEIERLAFGTLGTGSGLNSSFSNRHHAQGKGGGNPFPQREMGSSEPRLGGGDYPIPRGVAEDW